jgi:hypothetical protein
MFSLFGAYAFYFYCLVSNTSQFRLFSEDPLKNLQLILPLPPKDVVSIILIIER